MGNLFEIMFITRYKFNDVNSYFNYISPDYLLVNNSNAFINNDIEYKNIIFILKYYFNNLLMLNFITYKNKTYFSLYKYIIMLIKKIKEDNNIV